MGRETSDFRIVFDVVSTIGCHKLNLIYFADVHQAEDEAEAACFPLSSSKPKFRCTPANRTSFVFGLRPAIHLWAHLYRSVHISRSESALYLRLIRAIV